MWNKKLQISKMYSAKKFKVFLIFLSMMLLKTQNSLSLENKILFKIDNEIITTFDIYDEIKFLKTLNPKINNLNETELFEISKNSIMKEKIKKIEIMKFVKELKINEKFLLTFIKDRYSKIEVNSLENFKDYLKDNNLDYKVIEEKFTIEIIWRDLIYQKFKKNEIIDHKKIKNEILQNSRNEDQREILLSEIIFNVANNVDYKKKYEKILLDIEKVGFKKTALIHSNSDSANNGGLIGWIKENNLNQNIQKILSQLKPGQISKPIRTSAGFIILKIEDEKRYESNFNLADKIEEVIKYQTDDQLKQFSSMYFNKIKKDLTIYGL